MQFGMMDGFGMGFGGMMLIFWIPVIIGLVLLFKSLSEGGTKRFDRNTFSVCQYV